MNNNKIYRIFKQENTNVPPLFVVDWMLHDRCTYDCSYCPPSNKQGEDDWLDITKIDEFCDALQIYVDRVMPGAVIRVLFTGGEPTVWRNFGELTKKLHARNWNLFLNSNGSRSINWWKEHAHFFNTIALSYHSEFVRDEEFIEKVLICAEKSDTVINLMMNPRPEFFNKSLNFSKKIMTIPGSFGVWHQKIQHNFGLSNINVVQYSLDQLDILKNLKDRHYFAEHSVDNAYDIEYDTGEIVKLNGSNLIKNGEANFFNYKCYAGLESIFIDAKGDIFRATCRVGNNLGNITDTKNISWPSDGVLCNLTWCGCITDILNAKIKQ